MHFWKIFVVVLMSVFAMLSVVKGLPQRNQQSGRAISGFNRGNDLDYDEPEDNGPPRKYGRKGYRSNCRCARISNCPKLQITIPRCPPEEFVCCFT